jgi:hypothetical protein
VQRGAGVDAARSPIWYMGWPLAAVGALVTYLAIRTAQRALHATHAESHRPAADVPDADVPRAGVADLSGRD